MATAVYQITMPPTKRQRISMFECKKVYTSCSFDYRHPQQITNYQHDSSKSSDISSTILSVINDSSKKNSHTIEKKSKQFKPKIHAQPRDINKTQSILNRKECISDNQTSIDIIPPISLQQAHPLKSTANSTSNNIYNISIICAHNNEESYNKKNNDYDQSEDKKDEDEDIDIFDLKQDRCSILDILCNMEQLSL